MPWVENKWFPRWRHDTCHGNYAKPDDGSQPIWQFKLPDWEGIEAVGTHAGPRWVMVNGRELPPEIAYQYAGDQECDILPTAGIHSSYKPPASHYCSTHRIMLYGEDGAGVVEHLRNNKSAYGMWRKEEDRRLRALGIAVAKKEEPKKEAVAIQIPEDVATELRAFLEPIVAANEKFVGLWKQGKIGPLVGTAMREAKGKYEGKFVETMLKEIVGA